MTHKILEIYKFDYQGHEILLTIHERKPRFNDEGILEMITLHADGREMYRDTYGREKALDFLTSDLDNEFLDITHDAPIKSYKFHSYIHPKHIVIRGDDYDMFINWLKESLTPINKKRIIKINRLKDKLLERSSIYYEK